MVLLFLESVVIVFSNMCVSSARNLTLIFFTTVVPVLLIMAFKIVLSPPFKFKPEYDKLAAVTTTSVLAGGVGVGVFLGVSVGFGEELGFGVDDGFGDKLGLGVGDIFGVDVGRGVAVGLGVIVGCGVGVTALTVTHGKPDMAKIKIINPRIIRRVITI